MYDANGPIQEQASHHMAISINVLTKLLFSQKLCFSCEKNQDSWRKVYFCPRWKEKTKKDKRREYSYIFVVVQWLLTCQKIFSLNDLYEAEVGVLFFFFFLAFGFP